MADPERRSGRLADSGTDSPRAGSPWSAQHEVELRRDVERKYSFEKARAEKAEKELTKLRAAHTTNDAQLAFMPAGQSNYYREVAVLQVRLGRWHPDNLADLMGNALATLVPGTDLRPGIAHAGSWHKTLDEIREDTLRESRKWLMEHAFRPAKFVLSKYALKMSGRAFSWMHGLFKYDYSARDAEGNRKPAREMMAEGSKVPAPTIFPVKEVATIVASELVDPDTHRVDAINVQHPDHKGAERRDVRNAVLEAIGRAAVSGCGGWATLGTVASPHLMLLSMDGAGLTSGTGESGVRVTLQPCSVQHMNQSVNAVINLAFFKESSHAESYDTLYARTEHVRPQLTRIYDDGFVVDDTGKNIYVRFVLAADKVGMCHVLGRMNQNYDIFGIYCDCANKDLYKLNYNYLTHYGDISYEKRCGRAHVPMWEALGRPEPKDRHGGSVSAKQLSSVRVWL